jgi:hypothetical protein
MANKYDLKIAKKSLDGVNVVNVLGEVPKGKTRFIGFIKISVAANGMDDNGVAIIDGELVDSDTTVVDFTDFFSAAGTLAFPDNVDVDNPLFSLAEGRFLNIKGAHIAATGDVTFVYFDE